MGNNNKIERGFSNVSVLILVTALLLGSIAFVSISNAATPLSPRDVKIPAAAVTFSGPLSSHTENLYPSDDAWVDESYPDQNHGSEEKLVVSTYPGMSYLKFSLSGIPSNATITSAKLWLYCYNTAGAYYSVGVAWVENDSWSESTITYNNAPKMGWSLDYKFVDTPNKWYSWDVTSRDYQLHGGTVVSIQVNPGQPGPGDSGWQEFYSKEKSGTTYDPYLEVSWRICGVQVSIPLDIQEGIPGTELWYTLWITNTGDTEDTYDVSMVDTKGWLINEYIGIGPILPGENSVCGVGIIIPENAIPCTRDDITVTVTSETDPTVSDSASCTALVPGVEVSISPDDQCGMPGTGFYYSVTVTNDCLVENYFRLKASDNSGWSLTLPSIPFPIPPGENETTWIWVSIPENAVQGTRDNITVTATSWPDPSVSGSASCIARVCSTPCSGRASVRLATSGTPPYLWGIRKARVTVNLVVYEGDNLRLRFLAADNKTVESETVIWSRTAPGPENVKLTNLVVSHPGNVYVKRVKLVLTDSAGDVILDNMAWYTAVHDDWGSRLLWIILKWSDHTASQQDQLGAEIQQIILNWSNIPYGRDQHDFSQA